MSLFLFSSSLLSFFHFSFCLISSLLSFFSCHLFVPPFFFSIRFPIFIQLALFPPVFHSRNKALLDPLESWKSTSFMSRRFPMSWKSIVFRRAEKEYVKNLSEFYRKQNDPKIWAFVKNDLTSAKSTVFDRIVPKEWDFSFYQL